MASKEYYDIAYGLRDLAKELNRPDVINTIDSEIKKMKFDESGFNNELSFTDFLDNAEVLLVDNAFDFDINEWEKENQEEIDEELSEDINNVKNTATSQFIKYQLTPDKVKEIVTKIINSEFNIINYWKTNQFKKKNNLTDDDLKDILKTLTEQDYKTNSISTDNSKNEAIIFIKQTNIKNLSNIKVYIKLDYDSIENSPVIVLSFHSKKQKTQLTSSYKNIGSLKEDIKDKEDYLKKLNIKSNGVYSLNYGWVKFPEQKDIPNIDMDEFEKQFKVWEDRYFDLLDELGESTNEITDDNDDDELLTEATLTNINNTIKSMLGNYVTNITSSPHNDYVLFTSKNNNEYAIPIKLLRKAISKDYKKLRYAGDGKIINGEVYDDNNNPLGRAYYGVHYDHVHNDYEDKLKVYKRVRGATSPDFISFNDFITGLKNGRY